MNKYAFHAAEQLADLYKVSTDNRETKPHKQYTNIETRDYIHKRMKHELINSVNQEIILNVKKILGDIKDPSTNYDILFDNDVPGMDSRLLTFNRLAQIKSNITKYVVYRQMAGERSYMYISKKEKAVFIIPYSCSISSMIHLSGIPSLIYEKYASTGDTLLEGVFNHKTESFYCHDILQENDSYYGYKSFDIRNCYKSIMIDGFNTILGSFFLTPGQPQNFHFHLIDNQGVDMASINNFFLDSHKSTGNIPFEGLIIANKQFNYWGCDSKTNKHSKNPYYELWTKTENIYFYLSIESIGSRNLSAQELEISLNLTNNLNSKLTVNPQIKTDLELFNELHECRRNNSILKFKYDTNLLLFYLSAVKTTLETPDNSSTVLNKILYITHPIDINQLVKMDILESPITSPAFSSISSSSLVGNVRTAAAIPSSSISAASIIGSRVTIGVATRSRVTACNPKVSPGRKRGRATSEAAVVLTAKAAVVLTARTGPLFPAFK